MHILKHFILPHEYPILYRIPSDENIRPHIYWQVNKLASVNE